ncbi:MAG: hypothetical protein L0387_17535 [Acidobacteria bacterium]|nr:hypothetical protein [Acidobacteriota bacterium]MCI0721325.1 hypothetical protein [Acidobacteriota bacterium]
MSIWPLLLIALVMLASALYLRVAAPLLSRWDGRVHMELREVALFLGLSIAVALFYSLGQRAGAPIRISNRPAARRLSPVAGRKSKASGHRALSGIDNPAAALPY